MAPLYLRNDDTTSNNDPNLSLSRSKSHPTNSNQNTNFPVNALVLIVIGGFICSLCLLSVLGRCLEKLLRRKSPKVHTQPAVYRDEGAEQRAYRGVSGWPEQDHRREREAYSAVYRWHEQENRCQRERGGGREKLPAYEEIVFPRPVLQGPERLPRYEATERPPAYNQRGPRR